MTIASLESRISADNPIRFIDAFVENIDLKAVGFEMQTLKTEGRPTFDSKIFLKLYLYGYFNRLRYSRKLEKIILPKCPCCKTGNLHRIAVFEQDGSLAWYLGSSHKLNFYES